MELYGRIKTLLNVHWLNQWRQIKIHNQWQCLAVMSVELKMHTSPLTPVNAYLCRLNIKFTLDPPNANKVSLYYPLSLLSKWAQCLLASWEFRLLKETHFIVTHRNTQWPNNIHTAQGKGKMLGLSEAKHTQTEVRGGVLREGRTTGSDIGKPFL